MRENAKSSPRARGGTIRCGDEPPGVFARALHVNRRWVAKLAIRRGGAGGDVTLKKDSHGRVKVGVCGCIPAAGKTVIALDETIEVDDPGNVGGAGPALL